MHTSVPHRLWSLGGHSCTLTMGSNVGADTRVISNSGFVSYAQKESTIPESDSAYLLDITSLYDS